MLLFILLMKKLMMEKLSCKKKVKVMHNDNVQTLSDRILEKELVIYPKALKKIALEILEMKKLMKLGKRINSDKLKEECGVFGILNNKDAAALTALGLHSLQHRGQEGCGIVTSDGKKFLF